MLSPQSVIYWLVNQWNDSLAAGQEETAECVSIVRLMFWLHLYQHIRLIAAGKKTTTLFLLFQLQLLTSVSLQWGYKYKCFPFENSFSFTPFHNEMGIFPISDQRCELCESVGTGSAAMLWLAVWNDWKTRFYLMVVLRALTVGCYNCRDPEELWNFFSIKASEGPFKHSVI